MNDQTIIESMLKENTGGYITDSGGAYGRNWERNQKRNFTEEPECTVTFSVFEQEGKPNKLEYSPTVNLYHWLDRYMRFAEDTDARLKAFIEKSEDGFLEDMENFAELDASEYPFGDGKYRIFNTYNNPDECHLSQVIQYAEYTDHNSDDVWLISVHGGCDVRGGYAMPRAFYPKEDYRSFSINCLDAGDYTWYYEYYNNFEASEHNPSKFDLFELPCSTQDVENVDDLPDLSEVTQTCVIVCKKDSKYDGIGYLVVPETTPNQGNQLDILTNEVAIETTFVAHRINAYI